MPIVKFVKEKKEIEVAAGSNLRKEAIKAGINLYPHIHQVANCHGFGQCGSCRVWITKGMDQVSPMGLVERLRVKCPVPTPLTPGAFDPLPVFAYIGNEDKMRLACLTEVRGDIEVETRPPLNLFGENFFS